MTNQITSFAKQLLDNHKILKNYLNFNAGYKVNGTGAVTQPDGQDTVMTDENKIDAWKTEGGADLRGAAPHNWSAGTTGGQA